MSLLKKIFNEGLVEIEIAFSNFEMTKKRADIWYKYSKHLTDDVWKSKIKNCIKGCRKIPTLADILDLQGYYIDKKELAEIEKIKRDKEWQDIKEEKFNGVPIPKKIKEKIDTLLGKWK